MADNLTTTTTVSTIPSGSVIATDDSGGAHYQIVEIADATTPTQRLAIDSSGRITVTGSITASSATYTRIQVTPTISTSIYAAKDAVGGLMTFANAAPSAGSAVRIRGVELIDKDQERAELELVLFAASITAPTDNASFDPTDAELLDCVGVIAISGGHYHDFADNAVARVNCDMLVTPTGTSLYGVLVVRGTPTYTATTDIVVTLEIEQP